MLFLKFIIALYVFINSHCTYKSGKFPFSDFHPPCQKKDWLHKNLTKLQSYPCEHNLSIHNVRRNQSGKIYYFVLCSSMTKNPDTSDANIKLTGKTLKMHAWERRKQQL